ncbi:hypothetical protein D3C71_2036300 [compost metagenome]
MASTLVALAVLISYRRAWLPTTPTEKLRSSTRKRVALRARISVAPLTVNWSAGTGTACTLSTG